MKVVFGTWGKILADRMRRNRALRLDENGEGRRELSKELKL